MNKLLLVVSTIAITAGLASCSEKVLNSNHFTPWAKVEAPDTGIVWPDGQAFPQFAAPADTLDAVYYDVPPLSHSELLMLTTLQGIVNKVKPRLFFLSARRGGTSEWVDRIGMTIRQIPVEKKYDLVAKYRDDIKGLVLYSTEKSIHYANLASTVAGLRGGIAVTSDQQRELESMGLGFKVLEDIRGLEFTKATEIYKYLYDTYWPECTKRTLLSLRPSMAGDIRDMAVAVGSAIVWLDPRRESERAVLEPFIEDLTPGKSVMLGWWAEERSGIGIGAKHGISTIPSDYYTNATVFAGYPHRIELAPVPEKPSLENKVYVALFLSDGDNIQYCEHTMCRLWDREGRGTFPINWTLSPGLVDLGPALLNYYNATSTDNDCLVSGPSGLGYAMFYDGLNRRWNSDSREMIEPYAKFTQSYLEKSGIRCVTIWDVISDEQMDAYEENARHLYGATLEDWRRGPLVPTYTKNDRLAFIPNRPCYTGSVDAIFKEWRDTIASHTGKNPVFLAAQGDSWHMGPTEMAKLQAMFDELSPGTVQICRADHFFSLFNEANGMDFNILMGGVDIKTSSSQADAQKIADGSGSHKHMWTADGKGSQTVEVDLHGTYLVDRYVLRNAGYAGMDEKLNNRSFKLETSADALVWEMADYRQNSRADVADVDFTARKARFVRLTVSKGGSDGIVRIGDLEIYGKVVKL